jgi:nucleoporin NUP42
LSMPTFGAQTPAFGAPSAVTSSMTTNNASIFVNARVTVKPGADKHDALLPPTYLQILPKAVKEAFEATSFTWNNIPEWIPPIELR